jgi:hypothetical protein
MNLSRGTVVYGVGLTTACVLAAMEVWYWSMKREDMAFAPAFGFLIDAFICRWIRRFEPDSALLLCSDCRVDRPRPENQTAARTKLTSAGKRDHFSQCLSSLAGGRL